MSVQIHNTETLESTTCASAVVEDVLAKLANPRSDYFLVTYTGDMLDLRQKLPPSIPSPSYLFKKSSVDTCCILPNPPLEYYFPSSVFKESINFNSYHNIREPFQSIPQIEKDLFENQNKAMTLYSNYMTLKDSFHKTKLLPSIRFEAAVALRLYMEKFLKSRAAEYEILKEEVENLHQQVMTNSLNFREKLSKIRETLMRDDIKEMVQTSLRGYANVMLEKSSELNQKVLRIEEIFLDAKQVLSKVEESYDKAKPTVDRELSRIDERQIFDDDFTELLNIIDDYARFRKWFIEAEAADQSPETREQLARKMQGMEANLKRGSNSLLDYKKKFDLAQTEFKTVLTNQRRIQDFYKDKSIREFVKISHKIKYLFSDKLKNFKKKIRKIDQLKEFLTIPEKIEEACRAAEAEENRSTLKMMEIQELYLGLCQAIIKDYTERKDFLQRFGTILPRNTCAELNAPVISRSYLRQLVKVQPSEELPESQINQLSKNELIKYYEGLLASKEQKYTRHVNELKKKEQKLQDHFVYLLRYKEKIQKDTRNQELLLKKYLEELQMCRSKSFSEFYAKKFQNEVEKLKEKEKVFKAIHLMNLKSLESENDQLKSSRGFK